MLNENNNDLCDQVLILLRKIIRSVDQRSRDLIKKYGLTVPQLLILKFICQSEEKLTASDIAKLITLSPATITPIIDRLEKRNLLERIRLDKDKRKVFIIPTNSGRDLFNQSPTLMHEQFISKFDNLKKWEQLMILSSLERVATLIDLNEDEHFSPLLYSDELN
ncbi:MarR family transcriptional regulator [Thiotrichales bacterium 19S3-7]|nr:MarR family transcriptional regulator [Thiotrichales bacterium 19S3-7]MCF6802165.1 MarR family transcriptional regulator [Thiotrichales bacterium 19S3-11]